MKQKISQITGCTWRVPKYLKSTPTCVAFRIYQPILGEYLLCPWYQGCLTVWIRGSWGRTWRPNRWGITVQLNWKLSAQYFDTFFTFGARKLMKKWMFWKKKGQQPKLFNSFFLASTHGIVTHSGFGTCTIVQGVFLTDKKKNKVLELCLYLFLPVSIIYNLWPLWNTEVFGTQVTPSPETSSYLKI